MWQKRKRHLCCTFAHCYSVTSEQDRFGRVFFCASKEVTREKDTHMVQQKSKQVAGSPGGLAWRAQREGSTLLAEQLGHCIAAQRLGEAAGHRSCGAAQHVLGLQCRRARNRWKPFKALQFGVPLKQRWLHIVKWCCLCCVIDPLPRKLFIKRCLPNFQIPTFSPNHFKAKEIGAFSVIETTPENLYPAPSLPQPQNVSSSSISQSPDLRLVSHPGGGEVRSEPSALGRGMQAARRNGSLRARHLGELGVDGLPRGLQRGLRAAALVRPLRPR